MTRLGGALRGTAMRSWVRQGELGGDMADIEVRVLDARAGHDCAGSGTPRLGAPRLSKAGQGMDGARTAYTVVRVHGAHALLGVGLDWLGLAWLGCAWQGWAWRNWRADGRRSGSTPLRLAHGVAGCCGAMQVSAWSGEAGNGLTRLGELWHGLGRLGAAREIQDDWQSPGFEALASTLGLAMLGQPRLGHPDLGQAWPGVARQGEMEGD